MNSLKPEEALAILKSQFVEAADKSNAQLAFLDVRSESEFLEGHFSGFFNEPILNDEERHKVGLTYKKLGQDKALELGHQLVAPDRDRRLKSWIEKIKNSSGGRGLVMCWRGGQRSKIAHSWISDEIRGTNLLVERIEGGYKSLRQVGLTLFETLPPILILSGYTGSGKTRFLKDAEMYKIDLENLANHKGSAFGRGIDILQPKQQTFENRLALGLWNHSNRTCLLEDESVTIGSVGLPAKLKDKMKVSPVLFIEVSMPDRIQIVFEEYVREPLLTRSPERLQTHLLENLWKIEKKLGGLLTQQINDEIKDAFNGNPLAMDRHSSWIEKLLTLYYDKLYQHAFDRQNRKIVFKGDVKSCHQWIRSQYA